MAEKEKSEPKKIEVLVPETGDAGLLPDPDPALPVNPTTGKPDDVIVAGGPVAHLVTEQSPPKGK